MSLLAKDKGGLDIPPCPSGMHHGICYGVVDIGTQPAFGKFPARRKVVILFEFPDLRIDLPDPKEPSKKINLPRALSIKETLTLASKGNLRPQLESWRGRAFTEEELAGFDLKKVLGANAMINVVQEKKGEKTYANIATINPLPTGTKKKTAETPPLFFSFDDVAPTVRKLEFSPNMPKWVLGLLMQSEEYQRITGGNSAAPTDKGHTQEENLDEDVPF